MTAAMRFLPLLLLASEAAAAPCEVSIARAPDDVRVEIESWVAAEPRCATQLEIRVVPTQGGYYLFARDPAGRVRERIVPDAQSAGVLVASWVADDVPEGAHPPDTTVIEIVPPAMISIEAPGTAPVIDRVVKTSEPTRRPARWLSVGGLIRMEDGGGGGVRAELDIASWGPWSAGLAFGISRSFSNDIAIANASAWEYGTLETHDLRAVLGVSRTSRFGDWELRLGGGAGFVKTTFGYDGRLLGSSAASSSGEGVALTAEVSAQLTRRFGNWALGAGPLVTFYSQQLEGVTIGNPIDSMPTVVTRERPELSMFAGVRRAL